ncbi:MULTISPECIES: hypothetical protein [Aliagarivorans]|uniref:hypothetical protein n=1 Tax=Aliagarivorans TaxID=882379 RepID=UPI0003FEC188|nr:MULTISPECIES: hypothetical protein [Aliagarivorans]
MAMKSSKEFATWLINRFGQQLEGVVITRDDLKALSGRQNLRPDFVADVHSELSHHGLGFVADRLRANYYFFYLPKVYWKDVADRYAEDEPQNILPLKPSSASRQG